MVFVRLFNFLYRGFLGQRIIVDLQLLKVFVPSCAMIVLFKCKKLPRGLDAVHFSMAASLTASYLYVSALHRV